MYSDRGEPSNAVYPVLRLRSNASAQTYELDPDRGTTDQDGPLVPHPYFLRQSPPIAYQDDSVDITREDNRARWKEHKVKLKELIQKLKNDNDFSFPEVLDVNVMWPPVDMTRRNGRTDDDLEIALEKYYVGAQQYRPSLDCLVKFKRTN